LRGLSVDAIRIETLNNSIMSEQAFSSTAPDLEISPEAEKVESTQPPLSAGETFARYAILIAEVMAVAAIVVISSSVSEEDDKHREELDRINSSGGSDADKAAALQSELQRHNIARRLAAAEDKARNQRNN